MRFYIVTALLGTSLLLAGNAALQKHDAVKAANTQLTESLKKSKENERKANALAKDLEGIIELERGLQAELQQQQSQLSSQLDNSKSLIARLRRENKELSDWADTALPDPVKRLRERPAITGAADYQDWLSRRNSLHTERDQSARQQPPAE